MSFSQRVNRSLTKLHKRVAKASFKALFAALLISLPGQALAEYFGLIHGRSSRGDDLSQQSIEGGLTIGRLGEVDFQYFGVRYNSRVAPRLVVFGDAGVSEFGNADGTAFGVGMSFELTNQRMLANLDISFKGSYHVANFGLANQTFNIEGYSLDLVVSGVAAEGVGGYVNFGYHHLQFEIGGVRETTELGFGAGLLVPMGPGELYAGFEFIDEVTLGAGFRFFIQQKETSRAQETLEDSEEEGSETEGSESETEEADSDNEGLPEELQ